MLIAKLNEPVHNLHDSLYPMYFKKYNYEEMKVMFKRLMENESFLFFLLEVGQEAMGYAWIEIREYPETPFKRSYVSVYVHQISINNSIRM